MNKIKERFLDKVLLIPFHTCWEWVGAKDPKGYGRFFIPNRGAQLAPRIAYELYKGEIGNKHVLHFCDNPSCVNPNHLSLGTNFDNVADMVKKNRNCKGSSRYNHKLTEPDILEIRKLRATHTTRELGKMFGVSRQLIGQICLNKSWKHV